MPPEQLVDVPVPQVHERSSRSLVYEQGTRFFESLHRRWEAEEAARLALLEEEQMDEEEEEEEVEVSRFLPHFRPRRWCWSVQKTAASAVAVLTLGSMSLLCRSSIGSLLEVPQIQFIARVRGPSSLQRDMGAFSEGLAMRGRSSSHR